MAQQAESREPLVIQTRPVIELDDQQFFQLCRPLAVGAGLILPGFVVKPAAIWAAMQKPKRSRLGEE